MQISVSGKNIEVGEALRSHVHKRVTEGVNKYLDRVTSVTVVFTKENHLFKCDISVEDGTRSRLGIKGRGEAGEAHASFDDAAEKIEKQLRRYKRRLKDHHKDKEALRDFVTSPAKKYVIRQEDEDEKPAESLVIAEKATEIESLTVSEAVMKMDLSDLPALMFFNRASGRLNVVYRRADGNISWVDPEPAAAAQARVA
ncbi:MAG: ribosome-associated translation inhibitor RaiA [Alphaproteobacteria bacterium]|nr:ribosome-associated translation inhibitor RaiA [Alphaproteobacteria bacterium]